MPAPPSMTLELGNDKKGSSGCDAQHSGAGELQGCCLLDAWLQHMVLSVSSNLYLNMYILLIHVGFLVCLFFPPVYPGGIRISTESMLFPPLFSLCHPVHSQVCFHKGV